MQSLADRMAAMTLITLYAWLAGAIKTSKPIIIAGMCADSAVTHSPTQHGRSAQQMIAAALLLLSSPKHKLRHSLRSTCEQAARLRVSQAPPKLAFPGGLSSCASLMGAPSSDKVHFGGEHRASAKDTVTACCFPDVGNAAASKLPHAEYAGHWAHAAAVAS